MSTSSTRGLPVRSKTRHGVRTSDMEPGRERRGACRRPGGITTVSHSFCQPSCHLRLPVPTAIAVPPSPHQSARHTACDITVQSNFLWSNPCMLPSLTETEGERKTDRKRLRERELSAGSRTRPEEVEWRETDKEREIQQTSQQSFKKKSLRTRDDHEHEKCNILV